MYILSFYVPLAHAEDVKQALFDVGAGKIGLYDSCAWQTEGEGQFRALQGSQPFVGKQGEIHREKELKVEIVCSDSIMPAAVQALLSAHPYEEPAYHYFKVTDVKALMENPS